MLCFISKSLLRSSHSASRTPHHVHLGGLRKGLWRQGGVDWENRRVWNSFIGWLINFYLGIFCKIMVLFSYWEEKLFKEDVGFILLAQYWLKIKVMIWFSCSLKQSRFKVKHFFRKEVYPRFFIVLKNFLRFLKSSSRRVGKR